MCIVNNTYIVSIESVIVRYKNLDYFHFGALNAGMCDCSKPAWFGAEVRLGSKVF